jgi:sphingolipid 4-desaturase/C4-monooxygenase
MILKEKVSKGGGRFHRVTTEDPHRSRRREILLSHSEIRSLMGTNAGTAPLTAGLVATQLALAYLLRAAPWWGLLLAAYTAGALLAACLYAMIHEAAHGLVFRSRPGNHLIGLLANLPLVTLSAEPFRYYHSWHHRALGDVRLDVGVPTEWEARWVGNSAWRKAVWLAAFPLFQWGRARNVRIGRPFWHGWMVANLGVQLAFAAAVLLLYGPRPLVYLLLSLAFAFGLHPLGTRVIQEHFVVEDGQETNNYAGPSKGIECNFGYHVEHHDFPGIPWNRLPRVGRIAPERYQPLFAFPSRWRLMIEFIFDPKWTIYRNTIRE